MADVLTPNSGDEHVESGAEPDLVATLYDNSGADLNKAAIKTLTLSIWDSAGSIVNGRDEVDVKDSTIGTLATDGTVTIKFESADMAFLASSGTIEKRYVRLTWTFDDEESVERTGRKTWKIPIEKPV